MSQLLLPLFPSDTRMLTATLGVRTQGGEVFCLLGGLPIYSHDEEDLMRFRYITSRLLLQGLCKNRDVVKDAIGKAAKEIKAALPWPDDPRSPFFTLVFDREAWEPGWFMKLWEEERIAVISYRKNVKDKWDSLSTPRANEAAKKLCDFLNQTNTCFPMTNLILHHETVAD